MSLYLSYNVDTKSEIPVTASWSNTDIPVLAVSTVKGRITFYQDEAINITEHDKIKDNIITAIGWHPVDMIMAYGLLDGRVGIWIDEENFSKEEKNTHEGKIHTVKFNHAGNRIVSADDKGNIVVWRFDGQLFKLCNYKQTFSIEEILFPKFIYEKMDSAKVPNQEKLNTLFFFCNSGGMLYLADDTNSSPEICRVGGKIKSLLFYEKDHAIIIITSHMLLVKCTIHFNKQLVPKKIKLSIAGNSENIKCTWAGEGLIAIVSGDDIVRFLYLETDQSYYISMNDHHLGSSYSDDAFTCIDFNYRKRTLIVGSARGKVYLWKCNLTANIIPISSDSWELFSIIDTIQNISDIKWSAYMGLILVSNGFNQMAMLSETILQKKMNNKLKIVQTSHKTLEIIFEDVVSSNNNTNNFSVSANNNSKTNLTKPNSKIFDMNDTIKGLDLFSDPNNDSINILLTWNGITAYIYEIDSQNMNMSKVNSFMIKSNLLALNEDSIIAGYSRTLDIYSFEGETKDRKHIDQKFGEFILLNTMHKFILLCTSNNYFGVYDKTRRNLKQVLMFRRFDRNGQLIGEIRDASINCKGNFIAILCDTMANSDMRIPETKFYIYDVEMDSFSEYEINPNRIPIEIIWDLNDPRIFGIQTEYARDLSSEKSEEKFTEFKTEHKEENEENKLWYGTEFFVFFHTSEYGIHKQESHRMKREIQGVFGLCTPNIYFIVSKTSNNETGHYNSVRVKKFQFFEGLEKIDDITKNSLIEFSIFMSSGKIDDAYKSVKNINNSLIWENMAKSCIKTKRLDVLEVCLSNMKFTRGMKALRESKSEKEIETRLAIVAMHMGMLDDAKNLLQQVNRWDVLIRFYIAIGEYENAIKTAKEHDRIDLENTYYRIAEHFERINEIEKAIENFKLSGCGVREIPRMLVQKKRIDMLEEYMGKGEDEQSIIWWASYLENQGEIEKALTNYKKANDLSNYVRLLITSKRIADAKDICDSSKNQGASFLLGKYYESATDIRNAIYYYTLSGRISYAFRLARQNNLDPEVYNLGLKAPGQTQNQIAEYFEKKSAHEKAITLYLMAGNIKKAMDLCLITKQYDKIREIADSVEFRNDKSTLRALADYFVEQNQFEKALSVLIKLKEYEESLKICENHKIKITLPTANAIMEDLESNTNQQYKLELIGRLAKLLMMQGDFEPSHQIFVKLGNLKKAMKCLIKMGVKDRVIEFANTCRMSQLYILAANFLQSLDWIENDEIVKVIVNFYTRAKAYLSLANYYELIANVEINEFSNYERSVVLYQEALNALEKFKEDEEKKTAKINGLINKIKITKLFLHVMSIIKSNEEESIKICNDLLNKANIDDIVREGDIYAVMIRIYLRKKDYQLAYSMLEALRIGKKILSHFIDKDTIIEILTAVNKKEQASLYN